MRFGMNLLLWTTRVTPDHLPVLQALAGMGYDIAELPIFDLSDIGEYRQLGEQVRALGLEPLAVTALNAEQDISSADAATRAMGESALDRMVDCAAAMGASVLSGPIHSAIGRFTGRGPEPDELSRSAEVLSRVAARAGGLGVRLGIEPLNRFECYLLNDTATTADFCKRVGHDAGILYDTFHAHIEEKDAAAVIRDHVDQFAVVHISENDRSIPGRGQVRWAETFGALKSSGYAGPLVVEAFGMALPDLSAATRIWRRMFDDELELAREALAFMRREWDRA